MRKVLTIGLVIFALCGLMACGDDSGGGGDCVSFCKKTMECSNMGSNSSSCGAVCGQSAYTDEYKDVYCCTKYSDCTEFLMCVGSGDCGTDEPADGDDGNGDDAFAICNDLADTDFCGQAICQLEDAYAQVEQACGVTGSCEAIQNCLTNLTTCIESDCDSSDPSTASNITACTSSYSSCVQSAITGGF